MGSSERMDAQFQLQESVRPLRRFTRWLGWLAHRTGFGSKDEGVMSSQGGNGQPQDEAEPKTPEGPSPIEELKSLLPPEVIDGLPLGATGPIYPRPVEFGVPIKPSEALAAGSFDWRRSLPSDSAAYQESLKNPKSLDDENAQKVLETVAKSLEKFRPPDG